MSILVRTKTRVDELAENSLCEIVAIMNRDRNITRLNVTVIPLNKRSRNLHGHSPDFDIFNDNEEYYCSFDRLYEKFDYIDYPYLRALKEKFGEDYYRLFYFVDLSQLVFDQESLEKVSSNILNNFNDGTLDIGHIHECDFSDIEYPIDTENELDKRLIFEIYKKYEALSPNKSGINMNGWFGNCSCCNKKIEDLSDYSILDNRPVCSDCVESLLKDKKIFYCSGCGSFHNMHKKYKHNLCKKGYNIRYVICSMCGKEIPRNQSRLSPTGNVVCNKCVENRDNRDKYFIRRYHHAPQLTFYRDSGNNSCENSRFKGFGIELEVDEGLKNSEKISKKIIETMNEEVYCMRDGSVPKGIEIISMPHEEKSLYSMNWKRLFYMLKRNKYNSERLGKCGLHIHISKKIFKNTTAIKNMIYFYEKFKKDITLFSRRGSRSIKRWSSFYTGNRIKLKYEDIENIFHSYTTYNVGHSHRYKCVNLQNSDTIEIRIMRGTINYKDFIATLNFIIEIAKKSNTITADKLDDYCEWLKGVNENTIEYMKKRKCFKKMYERS